MKSITEQNREANRRGAENTPTGSKSQAGLTARDLHAIIAQHRHPAQEPGVFVAWPTETSVAPASESVTPTRAFQKEGAMTAPRQELYIWRRGGANWVLTTGPHKKSGSGRSQRTRPEPKEEIAMNNPHKNYTRPCGLLQIGY